VNQLPAVLIVKFGSPLNPEGGPEFRVRRDVVLAWLTELKRINPAYSDISINLNVISSLPNDGSVLEHVQRLVEEEEVQTENVANATTDDHHDAAPAGGVDQSNGPPPGGSAALNEDDDDLDDDSDEQLNGPDQCGATGQVLGEMGLNYEYLAQPADRQDNAPIDEVIRRQILQIRPDGAAINDYSTPNLQAHGFPTLFPFGVGDFTNHDRPVDNVPMKDVMKHLLFYCIAKEDGTFFYPFVVHERWAYWAQNTLERHRFLQQRSICLNRLPNQVTGMDMDELNEFIREGDPDMMRSITGKMQMFSANIQGSDA
jgi:hypothetical protein